MLLAQKVSPSYVRQHQPLFIHPKFSLANLTVSNCTSLKLFWMPADIGFTHDPTIGAHLTDAITVDLFPTPPVAPRVEVVFDSVPVPPGSAVPCSTRLDASSPWLTPDPNCEVSTTSLSTTCSCSTFGDIRTVLSAALSPADSLDDSSSDQPAGAFLTLLLSTVLPVVAVVAVVCIVVFVIYRRRRQALLQRSDSEAPMLDPVTIRNSTGMGSYGIVYKGRYKGKKVMLRRLRVMAGHETAFNTALKAAINLRHKHILQVFGQCQLFQSTDGFLYAVTAWPKEGCLLDLLRAPDSPLSVTTVVGM
eukprot:TRINITY_DN14841_c0_g1_i1.p1 TRINITY_DN14841_c0_g1~~TRINITY_DN14841_c0_g1_i1.p1  ORF type:complete len:305 (+),score=71.70 TRINITY_DN14841_c0_g1_i1:81-995(+)